MKTTRILALTVCAALLFPGCAALDQFAPVATQAVVTAGTQAALARFPEIKPYVPTIIAAARSLAGGELPSPERLTAAVNAWVDPYAAFLPGIVGKLKTVASGFIADYAREYPKLALSPDKAAALEGYLQTVEEAAR